MNPPKHPRLVLFRRPQTAGQPTLGSLLWETNPTNMRHLMIRSIELPWKDNAAQISCFPEGLYQLQFTMSNRFKRKMWEVMKVPGRGGIRIHVGNYLKDTEGCILPCLQWVDLNKDGVLDGASSKTATDSLEEFLRPYEKTGLWIDVRRAKV